MPAGYALETQTRPFYGKKAFDRGTNVSVVVHELAHQWYGDSVSLKDWKDIWVNEGFAAYSQWLWSEKEGEGTAQELADYVYDQHPADDPFWTVKPGDPGAEKQFDDAVYDRGALALQALRNKVGDKVFFEILKSWPTENRYGNASVADFVAFAEKKSGKELADFFDTWLFQTSKPSARARRSGPSGAQRPGRAAQVVEADRGHARRAPALIRLPATGPKAARRRGDSPP